MTDRDAVWAALDVAAHTVQRFALLDLTKPEHGSEGWTSCVLLLDPSFGKRAEHVDADLKDRGLVPTVRDRQAATLLAFQQYAHRVTGPAVAAWALCGILPEMAPEDLAIQLRPYRPAAIGARVIVARPPSGAAEVVAHLLDDHLLSAVDAFEQVQRVGRRAMLGAIASSLAGVFTMLSAAGQDPQWCAETGQSIVDADERLRGLATVRVVTDGERSGAFHERATCCLAYQLAPAPPRQLCASCNLHDADDREVAFQRTLASGGV